MFAYINLGQVNVLIQLYVKLEAKTKIAFVFVVFFSSRLLERCFLTSYFIQYNCSIYTTTFIVVLLVMKKMKVHYGRN